jgi:acyl CoA:acetate/3-ketoacid CoA transferase
MEIAQNAKKVVFCGTFDAQGSRIAFADGRLSIVAPGKVRKFVSRVDRITFSGAYARQRGQEVLYVTERAVFRLAPSGLALVEIAPGLDLERDVLAHMDFRPDTSAVGVMPADVFR